MFDLTSKNCWKIFIIIEEEILKDEGFESPKLKAKKVIKIKSEFEFLLLKVQN